MTEQSKVLFQKSNHIATLTLNRPEVHNAFDDESIAIFLMHLETINQDPSIRALVLTHNGPNFCAGADLNWMRKMADFTYEENLQDAKQLALMFKNLFELSIPTIALIRGGAYGGGAGLAAICKIVIAQEDASFCFSETKLGLIPATISPYVVHALGQRQALRLFQTAQKISAAEAFQMGLCHEVKSEQQLMPTLTNYIDQICRNGPEALKACTALIRNLSPSPISENTFWHTVEQIAAIRTSPEGKKGILAFLEKRHPDWIL